MNAKISEIFRSIQGEGKYTGVSQVFVRFFGCNIHCVWCDTPRSIGDTTQRYDEYGVEDLVRVVENLYRSRPEPDDSARAAGREPSRTRFPEGGFRRGGVFSRPGGCGTGCHSVSLTGGEPLGQAEFLKDFLPRLKALGMTTFLETSGILYEELTGVIDHVDIVSMDLKLPSSTECPPFWEEHKAFLKTARRKDCYVKAVISSQTTAEDVDRAVALVAGTAPETMLVLQPNFFDRHNGVLAKCEAYKARYDGRVASIRVMPQMHKMLKIK